MPTRLPLLLVGAVLLTVPLGCGDEGQPAPSGGDQPASGSDEAEVVSVIEQSSTESDPAHCTDLSTQAFLEQTTFELGQRAVKACEKSEAEDEDPAAESVEVSDVEIEAGEATATATLEGGSLGSSTLELELVMEEERWKLDRIDAIPELDREAVLEDLASDLQEDQKLPDEAAECIVEEFETLSEEQLEELFVSGDPRKLLQVIAPCASQDPGEATEPA